MKYLKKLSEILNNGTSFSYNEACKNEFKVVGEKAMNDLAKALSLKEYTVSFNPGGPAVSGDLHLMGMWSEENGVYVSINKELPTGQFMYRTIKHMTDFSGGSNNWLSYDILAKSAELTQTILRLKE